METQHKLSTPDLSAMQYVLRNYSAQFFDEYYAVRDGNYCYRAQLQKVWSMLDECVALLDICVVLRNSVLLEEDAQ